MPEPTPATPQVEGTPPIEEPQSSGGLSDEQLGQLFDEAGQREEAEAAEKEAAKQEAAKEPPKPAVDPSIDERFNKLETQFQTSRERSIRLETENAILRTQLEERHQQPQAQQPKPKNFFEELGVTREEIDSGLRSDAAGTIVNLLEKANQRGYERARQEAIQAATQEVVGINAHQDAWKRDMAATTGEYGELLNTNPEFKERADKVYNSLTAQSPAIDKQGTRWHPNAMYTAVSIAAAQLAREGKLSLGPQTPQAQQSRQTNVIPIERKPKPSMPVLGDTSGSGSGGVDPLLADIPGDELAIMRKTARDLGVPLERYIGNIKKFRKQDRSYGGF
jgi:chromosome segregation ATPase